MEPLELMRLGTPLLSLGLLVFMERINAKVDAIREDIQEIRRGMTWNDTCEARHEEINRRLARLENVMTDQDA
jgi:hypothetical protein